MAYQVIHERISESDYKTWQLYLLIGASVACLAIYLPIPILRTGILSLEAAAAPYDWLVILGVQGILIGFSAEYLYDQDDRYAKKGRDNGFTGKDGILATQLFTMIVVAGIITYVVPQLVHSITEYLILQTSGAVLVGAILLVHHESSNWNEETEAPALIAGAMLAILPPLL